MSSGAQQDACQARPPTFIIAAGVLSFIMALVGLGGTSWITQSKSCDYYLDPENHYRGSVCVGPSYAGLWGGGSVITLYDLPDVAHDQTTVTTFSCSDETTIIMTGLCKFGGAPVMMIVATILFVVACSASVMPAMEKTVFCLPNPRKTAGCIFVSCAILEWIALIGMATKDYSTGATGIAVVMGSLLAAATGVRLIMLSGTDASKSAMALAENTPYQGV
jgi:hypothetical protein